ncbi:MAG: hypothetical protein WAK16_02880 [Candidatus Cybelea sp.]
MSAFTVLLCVVPVSSWLAQRRRLIRIRRRSKKPASARVYGPAMVPALV